MATFSPGGVATQRATLVRMVRVMFPHPDFPDGPYERTADAILTAADGEVRMRAQLDQGLRDLDALGSAPFAELDDAAALALLQRVSTTSFFAAVRAQCILSLYDDREVHRLLGYEGPAHERGGYLHRGYDDLDWLPDARIEEAD